MPPAGADAVIYDYGEMMGDFEAPDEGKPSSGTVTEAIALANALTAEQSAVDASAGVLGETPVGDQDQAVAQAPDDPP